MLSQANGQEAPQTVVVDFFRQAIVDEISRRCNIGVQLRFHALTTLVMQAIKNSKVVKEIDGTSTSG
jgi:hypothetical protein